MIVLKIGGAAGVATEKIVQDLRGRRDVVVVHGGSDAANVLSEKLGHPPRFITSPSGHVSRFTDSETLDIFTMALAGVNARLVAGMRKSGINAVGLSGIDGGLLMARRKDTVRSVEHGKTMILRGDHTGTIDGVNTALLTLLLSHGYVPVIGVPVLGHEGDVLNADADRAAAQVAGAMKAEALVILTNVPGVLRDPSDRSTLIAAIARSAIDETIERFAQGRMKKKLLGAKEAIEAGVPRVILALASVEKPLTRAIEGVGTVIS
ncbi:MAG: [LysW]-aminoadipate kinase [Euryarchaeota archaeon]|nr:[LysW]-aminoadipate kinase [Euryarchaeota archaeon]